jgi:hypothetical protein
MLKSSLEVIIFRAIAAVIYFLRQYRSTKHIPFGLICVLSIAILKKPKMRSTNLQHAFMSFCFMVALCLTACQKGSAPTASSKAETSDKARLSPERVDIRGSIIRSKYNQGQVMLEVEGTPAQSQNSRFTRAYVLVQPSTQIVGTDGQSISLSELGQGQNVAILLRGGGQGNLEGIGIARTIWLEQVY